MDRQATIIIIIAVALVILVLLVIKNQKDRKKEFPPQGTDPVEEQNREQHSRDDKL